MNQKVLALVEDLSCSHQLNHLPGSYGGGPLFTKPLMGVSRGNDPIFQEFKRTVASSHLTPAELWVESGFPDEENIATRLRILSIVFPYASRIREGGKSSNDKKMPTEMYCVARNFANPFIDTVLSESIRWLKLWGFRATAGIHSKAFKICLEKDRSRVYSNWSERHIAFSAGVGTFGLHAALITEAGCNVRLGSIVTDAPLEVTARESDEPYGNCLHFAKGTCGACTKKCPAVAISDNGHDKYKCFLYGKRVREEMCGRSLKSVLRASRRKVNDEWITSYPVGCALCQFGVPCTHKNPAKSCPEH